MFRQSATFSDARVHGYLPDRNACVRLKFAMSLNLTLGYCFRRIQQQGGFDETYLSYLPSTPEPRTCHAGVVVELSQDAGRSIFSGVHVQALSFSGRPV